MVGTGDQSPRWWQTRWFVVAMAFVAAIPLIWPTIPPLVDLPGHMGRYRVQLAHGSVDWLNDWYNFDWQLIGNLGVDLLIIPLEPLMGLEPAVKMIVLLTPVLTATGLLWIAREVHGRVPATALFALPIVYSFPLHFGFINSILAMALALNAFGLWLHLARRDLLKLRAILFVPIGLIIWICHTYGWGLLGLLAFSSELVRQWDKRPSLRESWWRAPFWAGIQCLPLCPPILLMLAWRSGDHVSGQTGDWFNWRAKIQWVLMIFRDRWELFDMATLAASFLVLLYGLRDPKIEFSRHLGISTLLLIAVYVLLPRIVFGSAYADMRLAPYVLGIALLALRPRPGIAQRHAALLAAAGLAFFGVRTAATTYSFWLYSESYDRELKALDHLPTGARLITFVGETCRHEWMMSRLEHIPGIALERKLAFSNDQWSMAGAQLLTTKLKGAPGFNHDPSQIVTDVKCAREWWRPIAVSLVRFPRDVYDYVWIVQPPKYDPRLEEGLIPVWRNGSSGLFRVDDAQRPPRLMMQDLGPYGREFRGRMEAINRRNGSS